MVVGFLVGRTTLRRCLKWCERNLGWLRAFIALENGIASPPTACRLLCLVDAYLLAMAFMGWVGEILRTRGAHIVIDGKALKAAIEKAKGGKTPMIMNTLDAATGLVVAQLPILDKECEITAIPGLLGLLDIRGSTVTIDAIGTQTGIMRQIVEAGGHFVLTVKKNQPLAYEEIMRFFRDASAEHANWHRRAGRKPKRPETLEKYDEASSFERNRDRHEYRHCKIFNDSSALSKAGEEWAFVKSVGHVRQVRIPMERDAEGNDVTPDLETFLRQGSRRCRKPVSGDERDRAAQEVGIVSDLNMTAKEMGAFKRNHWSIENKLHHVLDSTFREDRSPARRSKNSMALIRKFAYNILRLAMIRGPTCKTMPEMMDCFADDRSLVEEYVFSGIASFY